MRVRMSFLIISTQTSSSTCLQWLVQTKAASIRSLIWNMGTFVQPLWWLRRLAAASSLVSHSPPQPYKQGLTLQLSALWESPIWLLQNEFLLKTLALAIAAWWESSSDPLRVSLTLSKAQILSRMANRGVALELVSLNNMEAYTWGCRALFKTCNPLTWIRLQSNRAMATHKKNTLRLTHLWTIP